MSNQDYPAPSIADGSPTYISPERVCELAPGVTKGALAQRRYLGLPPTFYKPSPRVVLYDEHEIREWIRESRRTGTAEVA